MFYLEYNFLVFYYPSISFIKGANFILCKDKNLVHIACNFLFLLSFDNIPVYFINFSKKNRFYPLL